MIQLLQLFQCLTMLQIRDHLIVGNVLMLMVSCATMTLIKVKLNLLAPQTEHMESAANQVSQENIVIMMVIIPAVNLQKVVEMDSDQF